MQKVTPKPYAPPKTGGTGKSIRLFSLRFHFISNRHALPETGTGVTLKPAYSVFDSILLNIVRNICPLVKRKTLPAEHFVQKNKNWNETPTRENGIAERPQTLRYPEITNIFSSDHAQSTRGGHSKSSLCASIILPHPSPGRGSLSAHSAPRSGNRRRRCR